MPTPTQLLNAMTLLLAVLAIVTGAGVEGLFWLAVMRWLAGPFFG